jgi:hypothetical protein
MFESFSSVARAICSMVEFGKAMFTEAGVIVMLPQVVCVASSEHGQHFSILAS